MKRAYRGRVLSPRDAGGELLRIDDGLLVVAEGRFASVAPYAPGAFGGPILDLRPALILPGFVDTHVHYPQTRVIGSATGPLLDWLERTAFPEEARLRDEPYARAVARELTRALLRVGTTTSAIFSSSSELATHVLFEALDAAGLRAQAGLTLMDQSCPEAIRVGAGEALAACERLIARWHGHDRGRLSFAVTPRFALSCSRPLLEAGARLASARGLLVQTHLSENPMEGEGVRTAHPHGSDYLHVYEDAGLLTRRTLFAHAIHLSASEWDRIAAADASIAHCPDSNAFLGSGRMQIAEARRRSVRVGLGSDVAGGRSFDIRRAMAHAYDNALALGSPEGPEAWFTAATLDGARALGLGEVTGSLEPGKDADFIAIRLPAYVEERWEQALGHLAFSDAGSVERVFVRGRALYAASDVEG